MELQINTQRGTLTHANAQKGGPGDEDPLGGLEGGHLCSVALEMLRREGCSPSSTVQARISKPSFCLYRRRAGRVQYKG
jgi:hypothetical protein